ncbi:uncharacterized protein PG998_006669 [Apiospora kogelbergensis]|uniref:uncharacterized protein n=1 Tax=Apiospora kogelbergensis TaxID=1337665 RepID=UPI00312ECB20
MSGPNGVVSGSPNEVEGDTMDSETQALRGWYDNYMVVDGDLLTEEDPLIQIVTSDTLDEASIEQRICELASDMHVANGFCDKYVYGGCFVKAPYFNDGVQVNAITEGIREAKEFTFPEAYRLSIIDSHLMTRGWAIKEKLLAPRTIHFGKRGAIWECKDMVVSECFPRNTPPLNEQCLAYGKELNIRDVWYENVEAYSAANLTYIRDKIPALAGIVRAVANVNGDKYLAGLWKRDIETQLC